MAAASPNSLADVLANMNCVRPGAGVAAVYIAGELVDLGWPDPRVKAIKAQFQTARMKLNGTSWAVRYDVDSALSKAVLDLRYSGCIQPEGDSIDLPEDQPRWNRLGFDDAVECPQDVNWGGDAPVTLPLF